MSRSVDLFIDAPASLEEVAEAAARAVGATVDPGPGPTDGVGPPSIDLETPVVRARLRVHRYRDDGALALSRYPYALSVIGPNDVRPQDSPGAELLRAVARELAESPGWAVLLVMDLQYSEAVGRPKRAAGPDRAREVDPATDPDTGAALDTVAELDPGAAPTPAPAVPAGLIPDSDGSSARHDRAPDQ